MEDVPGVAGQLNADGRLRTAGGVTDISGKAEIADFTTPGDAQVAPRSAKLAYDARIDTPNDALTLRTFDLDSPLASVKLAGSISELSQTRTVKLTGNYRLSWDDVMPVVYAVAPDLREKVKISGKSESTVRFSGDLADAAGASQLAGVTALTELTWSSAQIMGIELGEAKFTPTLKNGTLTLPPAAISAAGGTVRAGGAIDMTSTPPSLKVPGELAMMEKVQITPELAQNVLSRFNPLFGQATSLSGTADLRVRDLELPLGSAVTTGGAGGGLLTLDSFQLAPGGMLAELLTLSGLAREMYVVDVSGLEFVVRDGRIHYRDLTLRFVQDKFDLKFYGSVGFDDTLDLFVSVPVGEKILERAGMRVGAAEQARLLSGLRIDIPVGGTRKNPRLNFSQVDIKGLLDNVVRKRTEDALTDGRLLDLIPGLGGRRNDDKSEDQKTDSARDPKSEDEPAEERKPTVRPKSKQKRRPRSP
jgi:hypothetical protein